MDLATAIVLVLVVVVVPAVVVAGMFVWAAVKDGQENRALHKRLGIRRGTRLGR
jgi:predicted small integral membrane protein